jgi:hypothetical protein
VEAACWGCPPSSAWATGPINLPLALADLGLRTELATVPRSVVDSQDGTVSWRFQIINH